MATLTIALAHAVAIIAMAFQFYRRQDSLRVIFWPALSVKLISGICLGLLYTYYYAVADTFIYFRDASELAALARENIPAYLRFLLFGGELPLSLQLADPRAIFFVRITSIFNLLTGDNYWAIGLYFSFFSFFAAWFLVKVISRNIPSVRMAAVLAFLFLPSVVFWTSGVLKESVAMAALFFLSGIFLKIWFREKLNVWKCVIAVLSFWIFWKLKYYYAAVFLAVVITAIAYRASAGRRFSSSPGLEATAWLVVFILPLVTISFLHPNFHFNRLLEVIVENNKAYNDLSAPWNAIHFQNLAPTPFSMLRNAPWAMFSGLFRPFFWEASSLIQFLPGLENTLLLFLFAACCLRLRSSLYSPYRPLVLAVVVYVIIMSVTLSLSAPNFGTLSRYRAGYISFFAFIILCNNPALGYVERSLTRLVSK